jgi:hypothetical protein
VKQVSEMPWTNGPREVSTRKGWRECEREFKAKRDPAMRVTLPQLRCLEKDDERREEKRVA